MSIKLIYFSVGGRNEQAEFSTNDTTDDIKELFRTAAEARESDILKLCNTEGTILNICSNLPINTPQTRYRLMVLASKLSDMSIITKSSTSIAEVDQSRLQSLQSHIAASGVRDSQERLHDIKQKVDVLREKLENFGLLSWMGLHKELSHTPNTRTSGVNHHTTTKSKEKVLERVQQLSHVQLSKELRDYLKKSTFNNWQWDDAEMIILLRQMFIDLNLIVKCSIEMKVLMDWLFTVYQRYNDVPFHNFKHCFMVSQMMYSLIWLIDLQSKMDEFDILTLIIAPICHDLDHPGYNNTYQINARTDLAMTYNDISPLENHHCSVAFEILLNHDLNILRNLDQEVYRRIRQGVIRCILATDMAKHQEIVSSFKTIIPVFNMGNKEQKDILMMILLKVADISNECRPQEVAEHWLDCLLEEYFLQSDTEKLQGLPVAPFMDRDKVSRVSSQTGFIKFVLLPLFESLGELYPVVIPDVVEPVRRSLQYYNELQLAEENEMKNKEEPSYIASNMVERKQSKSLDNSNNNCSSNNITAAHQHNSSGSSNISTTAAASKQYNSNNSSIAATAQQHNSNSTATAAAVKVKLVEHTEDLTLNKRLITWNTKTVNESSLAGTSSGTS